MALFDAGTQTSLEDILRQKASNTSNDITNQFAKQRRQLVGQQAHSGRLTSGVSNYNFGDLASQELGAQGDVQSGLAEALGQVPADDLINMRESDRSRSLAELIASLSKPSALEQTLGLMTGGAKAFTSAAGAFA